MFTLLLQTQAFSPLTTTIEKKVCWSTCMQLMNAVNVSWNLEKELYVIFIVGGNFKKIILYVSGGLWTSNHQMPVSCVAVWLIWDYDSKAWHPHHSCYWRLVATDLAWKKIWNMFVREWYLCVLCMHMCCVWVYVCAYICVYEYASVYMYVRVYACMYLCVVYACVLYVCIGMLCMCVCIFECCVMWAYVSVCICEHMQARVSQYHILPYTFIFNLIVN